MANLPRNRVFLLREMFQKVFPIVEEEMDYWKKRAAEIPSEALRAQALSSIATKTFHCQGGSVYALLAGEQRKEAIRFIVAYQTISDYLDNLCDRSISLDPEDFETLHQSMKDALTPSSATEGKNYYVHREDQEDGGYLAELVKTCQNILKDQREFPAIQEQVWKLEADYAALQIHKHVEVEERLPRLRKWHEENKQDAPGFSWYEYAAATGSTLGIFCLIGYLLDGKAATADIPERVVRAYFPHIQALHILLDYYIDQDEDREETDLNFCSYYESDHQMTARLLEMIKKGKAALRQAPDRDFHEMIQQGLVALYMADDKVKQLPNSEKMKKDLMKASGAGAQLIHYTIKFYYKMEEAGERK